MFGISSEREANRILREILGTELGIEATAVAIEAEPQGKPRLTDPGPRDLRFNLSHSGKLAALALCEGVEVGIDVEWITAHRPFEYVQDWTRREAYLKGTGAGLRGAPRHLAFAEDAEGRWEVLDQGDPVADWRVVDLEVPAGYAAALASESEVDVSISFDPTVLESRENS